jgi:hypothetical protein
MCDTDDDQHGLQDRSRRGLQIQRFKKLNLRLRPHLDHATPSLQQWRAEGFLTFPPGC